MKRKDENGRLTHVLCAIRSISDAKRREQTLIYQVAEAKKDAAVKTRFLSNMSHDIRTPHEWDHRYDRIGKPLSQ